MGLSSAAISNRNVDLQSYLHGVTHYETLNYCIFEGDKNEKKLYEDRYGRIIYWHQFAGHYIVSGLL